MSSSSAGTSSRSSQDNSRKQKKRLSPEQLADLKLKSKCRLCQKFGHWVSDHNKDGSLKHNVPSNEKPVKQLHQSPDSSDTVQTLTFNMATVVDKSGTLHSQMTHVKDTDLSFEDLITKGLGPLVDDAAPYSAIGIDELKFVANLVFRDWSGYIDQKPAALSKINFWKYGSVTDASPKREIIGSILLPVICSSGSIVNIRHLVLADSSQWVVGRNVTMKYEM